MFVVSKIELTNRTFCSDYTNKVQETANTARGANNIRDWPVAKGDWMGLIKPPSAGTRKRYIKITTTQPSDAIFELKMYKNAVMVFAPDSIRGAYSTAQTH